MDDLLKILIVDDEPEARELLKYTLHGEEGLKVVGMASHVDEAVQMLKKERPDLVFLDIQMPGKDGFNFIEQVHEEGYYPGIIFITAYEHYAIQAIRNSVFDYILKPVQREELFRAIDRFRTGIKADQKQDFSKLLRALKESGPSKVKLNTRSGYILIDPQEVVYCQADGNYTHLQLVSGTRELTTQNLGAIEGILHGDSFFRASRSYLLNLKYLCRVDRKSCNCVLEYQGDSYTIRIPAQKIKILEASFS
ncbi:MAG: LytTR family DNA-binding domain-containing protein [Bacteroidota bacterium]